VISTLTERIRACMEKHPEWTDRRVSGSIRGATLTSVHNVRAGVPIQEQEEKEGDVTKEEKQSVSGIISLDVVRLRYDTLASIRRELKKIPFGKIIPERELCFRSAGKDNARFRRTVENNIEEFKNNRVKLKLDQEASDGQWWWGSAGDVKEAIRLRDE